MLGKLHFKGVDKFEQMIMSLDKISLDQKVLLTKEISKKKQDNRLLLSVRTTEHSFSNF